MYSVRYNWPPINILFRPKDEGTVAEWNSHKPMPVIHISYIKPDSDDLQRQRQSPGAGVFDSDAKYKKHVQPQPRNFFPPEGKMVECDLDHIAYNELADHHNVTGLAFHLLGHGFIDRGLHGKCDFSTYNKVVDIDFNGHFSYITPAFQIISQLKALRRVRFSIGFGQRDIFLEDEEENYKNIFIQPNPQVDSLSIQVNPRIFLMGSEQEKKIADNILHLILHHTQEMLPNINHLDLRLPAGELTTQVFSSVINNCRFLKGDFEILVDVVTILGLMILHYEVSKSVEDEGIHCLKHNGFPQDGFGNFGNSIMEEDLCTTLEAIPVLSDFLVDLQESRQMMPLLQDALRNTAVGGNQPNMDTLSGFQFFQSRPPPGFEHIYNAVRISNHRRLHKLPIRRKRARKSEMDAVFYELEENRKSLEDRIQNSRLFHFMHSFRREQVQQEQLIREYDLPPQ